MVDLEIDITIYEMRLMSMTLFFLKRNLHEFKVVARAGGHGHVLDLHIEEMKWRVLLATEIMKEMERHIAA